MISSIRELWDIVSEYGYNVRQKNINGLDAWNKIKPLLKSVKYSLDWKNNFYDDLLMVGVRDVDKEDMPYNEWQKHHFLIQHGRIVKRNPPSIMRLMQIAFNSGQFRAVRDSPIYTQEMLDFYDDNKLSDVETYIDISSKK